MEGTGGGGGLCGATAGLAIAGGGGLPNVLGAGTFIGGGLGSGSAGLGGSMGRPDGTGEARAPGGGIGGLANVDAGAARAGGGRLGGVISGGLCGSCRGISALAGGRGIGAAPASDDETKSKQILKPNNLDVREVDPAGRSFGMPPAKSPPGGGPPPPTIAGGLADPFGVGPAGVALPGERRYIRRVQRSHLLIWYCTSGYNGRTSVICHCLF